jgi:hypothetical protein
MSEGEARLKDPQPTLAAEASPGEVALGSRGGAPLVAPAVRQPIALTLPSGRSIEATSEGGEETVRILASSGACVLTVRLTDEGPVLRFEGASLELAATRKLELSCEELSVRASGGAAIHVGGDLDERVQGSARRSVRGAATTTARSVDLEASPGGIELRANDDVRVQGERVLLNSDDPPMPLTWDEYRARQASPGMLPSAPDADDNEGRLP